MQTKLTLRMDEAVIRKAKLLAKRNGSSVSRLFGDFIISQSMNLPKDEDLPPITASMLGALCGNDFNLNEEDYYKHLEEKHR